MVARLPSSWSSLVVPGTGCFNGSGHWSEDVSCGFVAVYLLVWLVAARLAAAPVFMAVLLTWASAYVSGTVTSHASGFPLDHGRIVVPSGRLPSCRSRLIGSLTESSPFSLHVKWCCWDVNGFAVLGRFSDRPAHRVHVRPPLFHSRMCVVRTLCDPVCEQLIFWVAHLTVVYPQTIYYYYYITMIEWLLVKAGLQLKDVTHDLL